MSDADNGQVLDLTVRILTEIRDEMKRTREDLGSRLDEVRDEVHRLGGRIDHLLTGPHRDEHEQLKDRVAKLEHQVFPPGPTRPPRRTRRAR